MFIWIEFCRFIGLFNEALAILCSSFAVFLIEYNQLRQVFYRRMKSRQVFLEILFKVLIDDPQIVDFFGGQFDLNDFRTCFF